MSSFDACKYVTKEEMVEICSIFIFTTNSTVRGERLANREVIVEYERGNPSEEEKEASTLVVSHIGDIYEYLYLVSYFPVSPGKGHRQDYCQGHHGIWRVCTYSLR